MSITRRGGHFYWLKCDACNTFEQLVKWHPGDRTGARTVATLMTRNRVLSEGWRASADETNHVCPYCIMRAGSELRDAKRVVPLPV